MKILIRIIVEVLISLIFFRRRDKKITQVNENKKLKDSFKDRFHKIMRNKILFFFFIILSVSGCGNNKEVIIVPENSTPMMLAEDIENAKVFIPQEKELKEVVVDLKAGWWIMYLPPEETSEYINGN